MGSNHDYTKRNGTYAIWGFLFTKNGMLIYYGLYNKDNGVRKDSGIVFEWYSSWIDSTFFTNYSSGILFKNTFFRDTLYDCGRKVYGNIIFTKLHLKYVMKKYIMDIIKE